MESMDVKGAKKQKKLPSLVLSTVLGTVSPTKSAPIVEKQHIYAPPTGVCPITLGGNQYQEHDHPCCLRSFNAHPFRAPRCEVPVQAAEGQTTAQEKAQPQLSDRSCGEPRARWEIEQGQANDRNCGVGMEKAEPEQLCQNARKPARRGGTRL